MPTVAGRCGVIWRACGAVNGLPNEKVSRNESRGLVTNTCAPRPSRLISPSTRVCVKPPVRGRRASNDTRDRPT